MTMLAPISPVYYNSVMFEFRETSVRASDTLLYDDFTQVDPEEVEYAGELSQHPALLDAYRLDRQLQMLNIVDIEHFLDLIKARVDALNDRIESDLYGHPVTISAPENHTIYPTLQVGIGLGNVSVSDTNDVQFVAHGEDDDDVDGDVLDQDQHSPESQPESTNAVALEGAFGGFGVRYDVLADDDDTQQSPIYKAQLYAKVRAAYTETLLADVTIYNVARMKYSSITFDEDSHAGKFEIAAANLEPYVQADHSEEIQALLGKIENSHIVHLGELRAIDGMCRDIFMDKTLQEDFDFQDSVQSYMELFLSPNEKYRIGTIGLLYAANHGEEGVVYQHNFASQDEDALNIINTEISAITLMPRTVVSGKSVEGVSHDTLGLYLTVELSEGWAHIPVECIQFINAIDD